jgi:hypothetical protein
VGRGAKTAGIVPRDLLGIPITSVSILLRPLPLRIANEPVSSSFHSITTLLRQHGYGPPQLKRIPLKRRSKRATYSEKQVRWTVRPMRIESPSTRSKDD